MSKAYTNLDMNNLDISNIKDLTVDGELKGGRVIFQFTLDAATAVPTNLKFGEVLTVSAKNNKGLVVNRPGCIVGYGLNYDVTVNADSSALTMQVFVEGSAVISESIDGAVANNKEDTFTQARGTDPINAGDALSVNITGTTATIANVIAYIEVQFDT